MYKTIFDCCNNQEKYPIQEFLKRINLNHYDDKNLDGEICRQMYSNVLEEIDIVLRIVRKNWFCIQSTILNESTLPLTELLHIRETINKCLILIFNSFTCCENEDKKKRHIETFNLNIKTLIPLILSPSNLEKEIYLKLKNPTGSKERCPIYHYFHTFQDVQFHLLLLYHVLGEKEELKSHLCVLLKDLILLSEKGYKQHSKSVFICDCNKHFWLLIQLLCEETLEENSFWMIFNEVTRNLDCAFILWLLKDVADLQAYDINGKYIGSSSERITQNFTFLADVLKSALLNATNDASILSVLKLIEPLVCNLWLKSAKIEVYQILWDFFGKRLNSRVRLNTKLTLSELVELIDTIIWAPKDCILDVEMYLGMLCKHLIEHPYQWGKMKGRMFSQLGPNKLKDLNGEGIFNVLLLFLCLTKVNFEDLSKKFLGFIEYLVLSKKATSLVWTFYSAFLIRQLQENRSLESTISPFIKILEEASNDQKEFHLIKTFVKELELIVTYSPNLQLHQWLLINTWIHKYTMSCYHQDLVAFLNILSNLIDKISHVWCDWEMAFKNYVYPVLKYSKSLPEISGIVAAKIVLLSPSLLADAFTFFAGETMSPKISAAFVGVILEKQPNSLVLTAQHESKVLQTWIKLCLLTRDNHAELTRRIVQLDIVPEFIKVSLVSASDPLSAFINSIETDVKQHSSSQTVIKLSQLIFCQAEKLVSQCIAQPENEATILRLYTCLAQAFLKIGSLVYDKHKSDCPFARLVSSILLPTELIMGKSLNALVLLGVKKTWHIFFEAIIKLNSHNDAFLERILREMVVRYMPHFPTVDSPMIKTFNNLATAEVILDKIAAVYLVQSSKESDSNIFKALRLLNDYIQSSTSRFFLELIVAKCLYGLFEIIMFHNQRTMASSVVTKILASPLHMHIEKEFENVIIQITEKHLAFNTANYFQLLGNIAKLSPKILNNVIADIKLKISNVERMRGVGYDKSLRLNMERLEATLSKLN